jgi:hypothetical protein
MSIDSQQILAVLDRCCDAYTFPMLDNGYICLAATRLTLFRSSSDWAMVIEVFGFSPRAGLPDLCVHTFASRLHHRDQPEDYINRGAYENYLANHPHDEMRTFWPLEEGTWQDADTCEMVSDVANELILRSQPHALSPPEEYASYGIDLEKAPHVAVFELCRLLAGTSREQVLATPEEKRVSVLPEMNQLLQLEAWHHPNVADDDRPGGSKTFQQLAEVLSTGDVSRYQPNQPPNTHWRNWPDGGTL